MCQIHHNIISFRFNDLVDYPGNLVCCTEKKRTLEVKNLDLISVLLEIINFFERPMNTRSYPLAVIFTSNNVFSHSENENHNRNADADNHRLEYAHDHESRCYQDDDNQI